MHRLFVALRPPTSFRARLLALTGDIPGARWQDDDQLHLTLQFIGEVERPVAEDIAAALGRVTAPRPTLALRDLGTFERHGCTHTLWAGVAPDGALLQLRKRIERAVTLAGIAADGRAFTPHITIARFGRSGGDCGAFVARHAGLATAPVVLDSFTLFESRLGRDGASYETIARYPLE